MHAAPQTGTSPRREGAPCHMAAALGIALAALLAGCVSAPATGASGTGLLEPLPPGGYERVTRGSTSPVVLLFHSTNCSYCRAVKSTIAKGIARGKPWMVYMVDIHEEPLLRRELGVGAVPCVVYFQNGQEVHRVTGWRPSFTLRRQLDAFFR